MPDVTIDGTFNDAAHTECAVCTQFAKIKANLPVGGAWANARIRLVEAGKTPSGEPKFRIEVEQ